MIEVDDLVDDEDRSIVSLSLIMRVQNVPVNKCERGGAKRCRDSIVNENSEVPPPPPPMFELVPPPLLWTNFGGDKLSLGR